VLRHNLEGGGWSVDEAGNGLVGLDRTAERVPNLLLLDLMMPVMDGFEDREALLRLARRLLDVSPRGRG